MVDAENRDALERGWFLLGAPWDCSGTGRGEHAAPSALRRAGVSDLVAVDVSDAATVIVTTTRDPETGVLGLQETVLSARALSDAILAAGDAYPQLRPLVLGGDCSILLGIVPALRTQFGRIGLCLVDGHPDFSTGSDSETGETADMELAILTGDGPGALTTLAGKPPMIDVLDAVLLGHREVGLDAGSAAELARLPENLFRVDSEALLLAPKETGKKALNHLQHREVRFWLHIDLDVLDPRAFPAVTYPQPGGPDLDQLVGAIEPLATSPQLLGVSIADFRPDLDPNEKCANQIVDLTRALLV